MGNQLTQYCQYIRNTGYTATPADFDEDWEPIGPTVRADMAREGLLGPLRDGKMTLSEEGERLLPAIVP